MTGLSCMAALVFNFFSEPAGYSPKLKDVCFDLKADVNSKVSDQVKNIKGTQKSNVQNGWSFSWFPKHEACYSPLNGMLVHWAILHLFEKLFLISWENNKDCHITMSIPLNTMEVQIKGSSDISGLEQCRSTELITWLPPGSVCCQY